MLQEKSVSDFVLHRVLCKRCKFCLDGNRAAIIFACRSGAVDCLSLPRNTFSGAEES
jgi:hypothetical protein